MHTGSVASISVSPDGITAASLGTDGCALLWDTSTGSLQGTLEVCAVFFTRSNCILTISQSALS